jgi:hypothetical protein
MRRKLPTGEALQREAERLGVSLLRGESPLSEPELQQRVLAARSYRTNALLNGAQTVAIIAALLITIGFSECNRRSQANQTSADFMLRFDDKLNAGGSGHVCMALSMGVPVRGNSNITDEDIDAFLSNYELLNAVYSRGMIDKEMANDAFSYDLEGRSKTIVYKVHVGLAARRGRYIRRGGRDRRVIRDRH